MTTREQMLAWLEASLRELLRTYLKTGTGAALPAEQEVQHGEAQEEAGAVAADLAGAG
jgi:hypothetical protein